jgi:CRISPR-associated exonuclease Cas4
MILLVLLLFGLASIFLLLAFIFFRKASTTQQIYQIPKGNITYTDLDIPSKPLFSQRLLLSGKPDYIIQSNKAYIPVEVKTGRYQQPQQHHIMQLAAYCHLVEETYGTFVPYGPLIYLTGEFTIPFTPQRRFELEQTIQNMRQNKQKRTPIRNHSSPAKCRNCTIHQHCKQPVK